MTIMGRSSVLSVVLIVTTQLFAVGLAEAGAPAGAPPGGPGGAFAPPPPPPIGRTGALIDLTGTWVPVITQDWRHRMMTSPKGDYESVPLTPEGRRVADSWDLAADNAAGVQCRPFGAPAILRQPGRMRVSWENETTLKLEFDAGNQVRHLQFSNARGDLRTAALAGASAERSWQGFSSARWFKQQQRHGFQQIPLPRPSENAGGSLEVETTSLQAGYLRKNGVPYSENARLTEYFDRTQTRDGIEWLTVTSIVEDPLYLRERFIVTTNFRRETNDAKWQARPCETDPPLKAAR